MSRERIELRAKRGRRRGTDWGRLYRPHRAAAGWQAQVQAALRIGAQCRRQGRWRVGMDVEQATQPRQRQPDIQVVDKARRVGGVEEHNARLLFVHVAPGQHARPGASGLQRLRQRARETPVGLAQRHCRLRIAEQRCLRVEAVAAARAPAGGKHRGALLHQTLLGTVVQHRYAGQRHQGQQRLLHRWLAADGQPAVYVVVIDEAGQPSRVNAARVGGHHILDAPLQLGRRPATREHVHQARVEWKVQHAG